jgi:endoglucanase
MLPFTHLHHPRKLRRAAVRTAVFTSTAAVLAASATAALSATAGPAPAPAAQTLCAGAYPATRDASNPLMLSPAPPAGNPLAGASFFVNGPRNGAAAGAIATLLGHNPKSYSEDESWATFAQYVNSRLDSVSSRLAYKIRMLEKIASEPATQRISSYSAGGTPQGVYQQTHKLFCHNFNADPGTIPVINTYFLHGTLHGCPTPGQVNRYRPYFERQINALASATGRRPVVFLLEMDYLGSSKCIQHVGSLPGWESLMRYEVKTLGALPHTVLYIEAGYSDSNGPTYTARGLNRSGISSTAGFYTNDTHEQWTINEIRWGEKISRMTHGAHFIVNTNQNGRGPKLNRHPRTQGVEDLCDPPGRGLGPRPTTSTGFPLVDAFMWVAVPGMSNGCVKGAPPSATFWPARAISLASRAQGKLGPGYPNDPY